jgi:FtsH-binding integral membrane protein
MDASHPIILIVSGCFVFVIILVMFCFENTLGRMWPVNLVLLALFTLASAYLLTSLASMYQSPMVGDIVLLLTGVLALQVLYAALPCCGYSFLISSVIALVAMMGVALILILPNPDAYLFRWDVNWTWALTENAERDHAIDAISLWLILLLVLLIAWMFQYNLWSLTRKMEPGQHVQSAYSLYIEVLLLLGFAIQMVGMSLRSLSSCSCLRHTPASLRSYIR